MARDFYEMMDRAIATTNAYFMRAATIHRKATGAPVYQPGTRKLAPASESQIACMGASGRRKVTVENGATAYQTVFYLDTAPQIGDRIEQGAHTYVVQSVEVNSPVGKDIAFMAVVSS